MRALAFPCVLVSACLAVTTGTHALAQPAGPPTADAARVRALLAEDAPESQWRTLGAAAVPALIEATAAVELPLGQRRAALRALAAIATPAAVEAIRSVVQDGRAPEALRSEAAGALALAAGHGALAELLPLIAQGPATVCAAAAEAVARLGGEEVREALEARLEHETDPELRARLQRSLTRLQP